MAANEITTIVKTGQLVFADHAGDYIGGTGNNSLEIASSTDVQLAPGALVAAAARQSTKVDLTANRAREYSVMMSFEMASDPAAGGTVDLYWSPSVDSSAAVANGGGCSGADGAYTGYAASTLAEGLINLIFIGNIKAAIMNDADGVPQLEYVGVFSPPDRYGNLVVVNKASVAFHTDDVEFAVSFNPSLIPEIE